MVRDGDSVFGQAKSAEVASEDLKQELATATPGRWNRFSTSVKNYVSKCIYGEKQQTQGECQFSEK